MKTKYCEECNTSYKNCNFNKHNCKKVEPKFKILDSYLREDGNYQCPDCEKYFSKNGLVGHYYRIHDDRGIEYMKNRSKNSKKNNKVKITQDEIFKKISNSLIKAHKEGRHPGWSHINKDISRRSYPEKFFINVFEKNGLFEKYQIIEKHPYGGYFIDFLFVDMKLIVEIDGSQHYRDEDAIKHDSRRDEFFIKEGFRVYRVKWSDVCNNGKQEISELLDFINNTNDIKLRLYDITDSTITKICECGSEMNKKSKMCRKCNNILQRKVVRPSSDILLEDINKIGYLGTGRKYGVSDTAIRKWMKNMEE